MRFNFKKISAVAISTLLTGMTMGVAAAANFPAPFVSGGVASGTAVVYGTGQGVSDLDKTYGGNIQTNLQTYITSTGGSVTIEGGESFALEKTSNSFNFNDSLNSVYSSLGKEEMDFLADGTYDDGDVDEDYEQTITLGTETLSLFADTDYEDDEPTVGFKYDNGDEILRYEIEFDDVVNYTDMVDTDMPILGKTYYVLAASSTQIDILDSADKVTIIDGESVDFKGKTISIEYIDEDDVKLSVDGESIDKLAENEYEELSDGSYIVLNENLYAAKEAGISKAVVSIGAGKMELIDGSEAELNDEDVDGLEIDITDNTGLSALTLIWKSHKESFLTAENAITMPGFEDLSVSFGGLTYADESETISFENGETFTISMDNYEIPVMWFGSDGNATLGEEDYLLVVATSTITNATWNTPNLNLTNASASGNSSLTDGLALEEDNRFIVTRIDNDLSDVETMYYQVSTVENDSGDILVELEDLIGDNDITFDAIEDDDVGDITINLVAVNGTSSGQAYVNFTASSGTVTYNKVVSDTGLVITLEDTANDAEGSGATYTLAEADKDEDVNEGTAFTVTVKNTSNDKLHVSTHNLTAYDEEESDDHYIGVVPSDLASKFTFDSSADEYDFSVEYFGKETTADVKVNFGGSIATGEAAGVVMITDAEAATAGLTKDLIIVGGSCINSAAAKVLGFTGPACGAAFTQKTNVGSGQFLIKSVPDAYASGKIALVVAGYEIADTANGVNYLINKKPDTSKTYKGTSATVADLVL